MKQARVGTAPPDRRPAGWRIWCNWRARTGRGASGAASATTAASWRAFATIWPITGREVLSPSRYRPAGRTRPRWRSGRTTPPTAATCALGKGAGRFNVAPAVEGCLRCLSANQAGWRSENPLPELADHPHGARAPTFSSSPGSAGRRRWGGRRAVSDRQAEPGRDVRQGVTVHPGSRCRAGCRRGAVGNRETNTTGGSDR